jgi:hypothetical protein
MGKSHHVTCFALSGQTFQNETFEIPYPPASPEFGRGIHEHQPESLRRFHVYPRHQQSRRFYPASTTRKRALYHQQWDRRGDRGAWGRAESLEPRAIATEGTVVGCRKPNAFLRGPKGLYLYFHIPNSRRTCATAVNNAAGKITGYYVERGTGTYRGFVYDYRADLAAAGAVAASRDIGATPLKAVSDVPVQIPGAEFTAAWGINSQGVVVGSYRSARDFRIRGFIATPVP